MRSQSPSLSPSTVQRREKGSGSILLRGTTQSSLLNLPLSDQNVKIPFWSRMAHDLRGIYFRATCATNSFSVTWHGLAWRALVEEGRVELETEGGLERSLLPQWHCGAGFFLGLYLSLAKAFR
nr:hypothetical protein [Moorena sp. SIO3F7]